MNYHEYKDAIEKLLDKMSETDLKEWIIMLGLNKEEEERESFLRSLKKDTKIKLPTIDWAFMQDWRNKVNSGEYYISKIYNEEYDDWYDDISDEYYVQDEFDVLPHIYETLDDARQYAYAKDYHTALQLYEGIIENMYTVDSEYDGMESITFADFSDYLLDANVQLIKTEYFFLLYKVNGTKAIPVIFPHLDRFVYTYYSELNRGFTCDFGTVDHIAEIMDAWLAFLKTVEEDVSKLLFEVLTYMNNLELMQEVAIECRAYSPDLYYLIAKHLNEKEEYQLCEDFTKKAIQLYIHDNTVREKVMKEGQVASSILQHSEALETFVFEAFRSCCSTSNYLELFKCEHWKILVEDAYKQVCELKVVDDFETSNDRNCINEKVYTQIKFFHGDFDELMHTVKMNKPFLGYSYSTHSFLNYAFLAICGKDKMPLNLIQDLFNYVGIEKELIANWIDKYTLHDEQRTTCIKLLVEKIDQYTDEILKSKNRDSYYKVAMLNIGLSYVLDDINIKEDALSRCKARFSNRPALYKDWKLMQEKYYK